MSDTSPDEAFARFVQDHMLATAAQVESARDVQADSSRRGTPLSLADALVKLGVITGAQRENVLLRLQVQPKAAVQKLLHYQLVSKLGEGGMGTVYLADDLQHGRQVALKVLSRKFTAKADFLRRFQREADAAGRLNHVNLVRAYSFGEDRGYHFYVMEYCDGETLDKRLAREPFIPADEATRIMIQAARGLQYAHALGVIHRDIKPANLIVTSAGVTKILDLGLSKNLEDEDSSYLTQSGVAMGTPHYMSPEQVRGERVIDGRADIYSLGATYYHLLTGDTPYHGSSAFEVVTQHLHEQIPDPRDIREEIPDGVVHILRRMMAKKPSDRYRDCGELAEDLERVVDGVDPSSVAIDSALSAVALPRVQRPVRRFAPGGARLLPPAVHHAVPATPAPARRVASRAQRTTLLAVAGCAGAALILVLSVAMSGPSAPERRPVSVRPPPAGRPPAVPEGGTRREAPREPAVARLPDREATARRALEDLRSREGTWSPSERLRQYELFASHNRDTRAGREAEETVDRLQAGAAPAPGPAAAATAAPGDALADWVRATRALPASERLARVREKLAELNPGLEGGVEPLPGGGPAAGLKIPAAKVTVLDPLRALDGLGRLVCTGVWSSSYAERQKGRGALADLAPLRGLPLREIDVTLTRVADLSPLAGMPLTRVSCIDTPVRSLEALRNAPLAVLRIGATPVADLAPLAGKTTLQELECNYTKVADLSPLKGLRLVRLWCDHTEVEDLSPLRGMGTLKELNCDFVAARDTDVLRSLTGLVTFNGQPAAEFVRKLDATAGFAQDGTPPPDEAEWAKAVDLLPRVDPGLDAVSGDWSAGAGGLVSSGSAVARIELPYRPSEAYCFRVRFTRQEGDGDVVQILPGFGRSFAWQMGAAKNAIFGFSSVLRLDLNANPTAVRSGPCLESGRPHVSMVEVRRDGIRAYLDGRLISAWKTEGEDLGPSSTWTVRDGTLPGLGSFYSRTVFHRAEVLELEGKGRFAREAPGPAEAAPAVDVSVRVARPARRVDTAAVEREQSRLHDEAVARTLEDLKALVANKKLMPSERAAALVKLTANERDPKFVPELGKLASEPEAVRNELLKALAPYRRDKEAARIAVGMLRDSYASIPMLLKNLSTLASIGHPMAIPAMTSLLQHKDNRVASEAARVMGESGALAQAMPPMMAVWEDLEKDRRKGGEIGGAAEGRYRSVGTAIKDAFTRLTGQRFNTPDELKKWMASNRVPPKTEDPAPGPACRHGVLVELARRSALPDPTGAIVREVWTKVSGRTIAELVLSGALGRPADECTILNSFESPYNIGDNYASRVRGYLCPAATGDYQFYLCSDDNGELYLSQDESPEKKESIAWLRTKTGTSGSSDEGWAEPRNWKKFTSQQSRTIHLELGRRYYIEALQKQGSGGDHVAVAWSVSGGAPEVIPGRCLAPYIAASALADAAGGEAAAGRGLVGWWKLDEAIGITAYDASGNDHPGALAGTPVWAPSGGRIGGALRFDEKDDDVRIPRATDLEPAAVSIAAWVRTDGGVSRPGSILRKRNGGGASYALQCSPEGAPGAIHFTTGHADAHDTLTTPANAVPGSTWVHVVGVYDPRGEAPQKRLYINGQPSVSKALSRALVYNTGEGGDLLLGQRGDGQERFKGWIDDVRIYDRALAAEEVRAVMAGQDVR